VQAFNRFDCFARTLAEFQIFQDEFKQHLKETLSSDAYFKMDFLAVNKLSANFDQKIQENSVVLQRICRKMQKENSMHPPEPYCNFKRCKIAKEKFLGENVGFQVRFLSKWNENTLIK